MKVWYVVRLNFLGQESLYICHDMRCVCIVCNKCWDLTLWSWKIHEMGCSLRAVVTGKEIMKETPPNADKSTTPLHTALSLSLSFHLSFSFLSFPGRWAGESFERTRKEPAAMNEASHLTRDASMYSLLLPLLFPSCFSYWLLLYICLRSYRLHIYVHTDINVCSFLN